LKGNLVSINSNVDVNHGSVPRPVTNLKNVNKSTKQRHGGIDIWGEQYWEGTSTLNINNFNKQLENSNFGMFSKEGTKRVIDIVKQSKTYLQAITKLSKLSQEDGFNEAMDTAVRDEVVVCYQVKN
jgi:hypothetical protein